MLLESAIIENEDMTTELSKRRPSAACAIAILLVAILIVGCTMNPVQPVAVKTIGCSIYGTAASPVDVTVQTDVEGSKTYNAITMPWEYYQFTYENSYSIQVTAGQASSTTGTITTGGTLITGYNVYRVVDAAATFLADASRGDIIENLDTSSTTEIYAVIDDTTLYIYEDIFPLVGANYEIFTSHSVWLKAITVEEDGSETEQVVYQSTDVLDINITP
jgi:hypothetical protein